MIKHTALGNTTFTRSRQLKLLLNNGQITFAGNAKLKIYGLLKCASGKRMKAENRVFFTSETEALQMSFRPCGHCMVTAYKLWKAALIS
jgi:methylphosphotriester-DNA--protein-cysteine methyltransferase